MFSMLSDCCYISERLAFFILKFEAKIVWREGFLELSSLVLYYTTLIDPMGIDHLSQLDEGGEGVISF